jgi:uncharacterized ferritin-like protein (DUF455 family)
MDWSPFLVCPPGEKTPSPRGIHSPEGLGDRLRTAAFAERQATEAFAWAAERFVEAPFERREAWRRLAVEERRHLGLLLARMAELGVRVDERPVSDGLWRSLTRCATWQEFSAYMKRAEERGRAAELSFEQSLAGRDPKTAELFAQIARDEAEHIASYE